MTYIKLLTLRLLFSHFFSDLNVLPSSLLTTAYRLPDFSYFKLMFGFFQIRSEKL